MKAKSKGKKTGLTLLGRSELSLPESPSVTILETFPNPNPRGRYEVLFDCLDFTSLCPVTGQPDFASISIQYVPAQRCIESKSLKFYLASFRNQRMFNEAVVNQILADFVSASRPVWVEVVGKFAARGGISLTVTARHGERPV